MPDLPGLEQQTEFAIVRSAIVADGGDLFRALGKQRLDQVIRESGSAKSTEHDTSAVGNIRNGCIHARINFAAHGSAYPIRGRAALQAGACENRAVPDNCWLARDGLRRLPCLKGDE